MTFYKFYHMLDWHLFCTPAIYIRKNNPMFMRPNLLIAIELFWFHIAWQFVEE